MTIRAVFADVGDRADTDVPPALALELGAVHLLRGSWGRLQATAAGAVAVDFVAELAGVPVVRMARGAPNGRETKGAQ